MMKYWFSQATGYYTGRSKQDPPAGHGYTTTAPPPLDRLPDGCGVRWNNNAWEAWDGVNTQPLLLPPEPPPVVKPMIRVLPVEFKLLWTSKERQTIKALRRTDPEVDDFMDIVEDPRLPYIDCRRKSTKDGVDYILTKLVEEGIIQQADVAARRAAILSGEII